MKKRLMVAAFAVLLVAAMTMGAFAATEKVDPTQFRIDAGELWIETQAGTTLTFGNLTVGGIDFDSSGNYIHKSTTAPGYTMADQTGTGQGWHVIFTCPTLACTNPNALSQHLEVAYKNDSTNIAVRSTSEAQPVHATNGPKALTPAVDVQNMNDPVRVVTTAEGYGMGVYTYALGQDNFSVKITRSTAYAGTYSGTLTATIIPGPGGQGSWTGTIE